MDKLSSDPDNSQEELVQVTDSLIPPPISEKRERDYNSGEDRHWDRQ